jgi:hypothetical protein
MDYNPVYASLKMEEVCPSKPVVTTYKYFVHIYFRFKSNLSSSHPSSSLHVSAVYGHLEVLSVLQKLLHCTSKLRIACERDIS